MPGNPVTRRGIRKAVEETVAQVKAALGTGQNTSGTPSGGGTRGAPPPSIPSGPTPGGINPR